MENYKKLAERWAQEISNPTELSKGKNCTEIDEIQSDYERKARKEYNTREAQIIALSNKLKNANFMQYAGQDDITTIQDAITLIIIESLQDNQTSPAGDEIDEHEEIFNFIDNLIS